MLDRAATRLSKASVANVYDVQKVVRQDFLERVAALPTAALREVDQGLRLALEL